MIEYLQQCGYQPRMGCTHVYFDACVYRGLTHELKSEEKIIEKAKRLKQLEGAHNFVPSGFSLVLWELITHLADSDNPEEAKACRKALLFAYYHLAESDGSVLLEPLPELGIALDVASYLNADAIVPDKQKLLLSNSETIGEIVHGIHSLALYDDLTPELSRKIEGFARSMNDRFKGKLNEILQCVVMTKRSGEEVQGILEELFAYYILYAIKPEYRYLRICKKLYPIAFAFLKGTAEYLREVVATATPAPDWSIRKKVANNIIDAMHLTVVVDRAKANKCIFVSKERKICELGSILGSAHDRILSMEQYLELLRS